MSRLRFCTVSNFPSVVFPATYVLPPILKMLRGVYTQLRTLCRRLDSQGNRAGEISTKGSPSMIVKDAENLQPSRPAPPRPAPPPSVVKSTNRMPHLWGGRRNPISSLPAARPPNTKYQTRKLPLPLARRAYSNATTCTRSGKPPPEESISFARARP